MKKRLNLFSRKKRFDTFAALALRIRKFGTAGGILLFVLFIFIIIQTVSLRSQLNENVKKKQLYLSLLAEEKDVEANVRYFKGKQTQLIGYEKNDARFVPYYTVLLQVLGSTSSQSATLDSIEIDKDRNTIFIVKFNEYEEMVLFLKSVESDAFLNNFESLSMASLNLSRERTVGSTKQQNRNYQLQFKGRFKEIKDENG